MDVVESILVDHLCRDVSRLVIEFLPFCSVCKINPAYVFTGRGYCSECKEFYGKTVDVVCSARCLDELYNDCYYVLDNIDAAKNTYVLVDIGRSCECRIACNSWTMSSHEDIAPEFWGASKKSENPRRPPEYYQRQREARAARKIRKRAARKQQNKALRAANIEFQKINPSLTNVKYDTPKMLGLQRRSISEFM